MPVHSCGVAVDLNTSMAGYWQWSGSSEGAVDADQNDIPEDVVFAFKTDGVLWGGKWHHFDGMYFEYRPEFILYARLADTLQIYRSTVIFT